MSPTSYNLSIAYLIVNYGSYEESNIAFPVCSCLHFAINIFPPICNSEAVTLTLKLMGYIMLLFHYSARFLKHEEPILQMLIQPHSRDLLIFHNDNKRRPHPPPQQAAVQEFQEFHLNYLSPEPFITYRLSRWKTGIGIALLDTKWQRLTATSNQTAKAEEQMSLERTSLKTAISEPSSATMPGWIPERSCKESRATGAHICLSSITQPREPAESATACFKGRRVLREGRTHLPPGVPQEV